MSDSSEMNLSSYLEIRVFEELKEFLCVCVGVPDRWLLLPYRLSLVIFGVDFGLRPHPHEHRVGGY